jgi:hypothetical protein
MEKRALSKKLDKNGYMGSKIVPKNDVFKTATIQHCKDYHFQFLYKMKGVCKLGSGLCHNFIIPPSSPANTVLNLTKKGYEEKFLSIIEIIPIFINSEWYVWCLKLPSYQSFPPTSVNQPDHQNLVRCKQKGKRRRNIHKKQICTIVNPEL